MCTAVSYRTKEHYFGRNLDLEYTCAETVTIVPRAFPLRFRRADAMQRHYGMVGIAHVADGWPLFYDAVNEKGLCIAGLNFPSLAYYGPEMVGKDNIAPYELVWWLLGQCECLDEVRKVLERINLTDMDFSEKLPSTPLHWMIADKNGSMVLEPVQDGIRLYDNPADVLTNSPGFDMQLFNLNNYMRLSPDVPENAFSSELELDAYSFGMGALGLPGDVSSMSRFVRAAFVRQNSRSGDSETESVSQFFHILDSVAQPRGVNHVGDGRYEITQYSACMNADKGIYYYKTYENSGISAVDMRRENLDGHELVCYPLIRELKIDIQNERMRLS